MRIVIASPPKMGNKWLKCLLGSVYDLSWLLGDNTPETSPAKFEAWVAEGGFRDDAIFHQHCRYSPKMCDIVEAIPAHLVTIVRNPYDSFVSMYYWLQTRASHDQERGKVRPRDRPKDRLIGKPIDDPAALEFLSTTYGVFLDRASNWMHSGRAVVARYEALHADQVVELRRITDEIVPVDDARIAQAIAACSADTVRAMSKKMATHIRSAKVGDSRERLSEVHYDIFRRQYGDQIRALGYEVR